MKRIFAFLIITMLIMSGCGKKGTTPNETPQPETKQSETTKKETVENSDAQTKTDKKSAEEATPSLSEFESMIDEFNTTEDADRKEELRSELEKILAEAEAAYEE